MCVEHFGGKLDMSSMIINTVEESDVISIWLHLQTTGEMQRQFHEEKWSQILLLELYLKQRWN